VTFLQEFRKAGFAHAEIIKTTRNLRTRDPRTLAAHVMAQR
jgi:hypothetical protein